jgi:anti-sigma B factor antagonist
MAVRRKALGPVTVIGLRGSFFGDRETDELEKALLDEAASGNTTLVVDMRECDSLNSMAIGVLMRAYANYKGRGGEIKLCGLGQKLNSLFVMTKLIMLFDHHSDCDAAVAAFAT